MDVVASLAKSLEVLTQENAELRAEINVLRQQLGDSFRQPARSVERSDETVERIIDRLKAWNSNHRSELVQISVPVVKAIAKQLGAGNQSLIVDKLKQRRAEIEEHHAEHGITNRYNYGKGERIARVSQKILLEMSQDNPKQDKLKDDPQDL